MSVTVGMISLGCPKNQVDAEIMLAELKKGGFEIVADAALAQVVIINTCAFIESAKQESIDEIIEIGLLKKEGRVKMIVVTGCLAERYQLQIAKELPEVDVLLGIGSNKDICDAITKCLDEKKPVRLFGNKTDLALEGDRMLTTLPFYAYLKIAEGCDNRCTYCAIPYIRGKFRSRSMESIVAEAKSLAKSGVRELVVVAQDTTRYGIDLYGKPMLPELLKMLNQIEELVWLRVLYAYPEMFSDELIEAFASLDKVVKYVDIPIQHASDRILKLMNRRGNSEMLSELFSKMRKNIPDLVLRTTLITGFPGETDRDFEALCEFLKHNKFERLGCFAYSCEEGTPAAKLPDKVDAEIAQNRADIIMTSQQRTVDEFNNAQINKTLTVAVEGYDKYGGCYFGRSKYDAPDIDGKIFFASQKPLTIGDFVNVKITDALDYDLMGIAE